MIPEQRRYWLNQTPGRRLHKSAGDPGGSYDIALDESYASLCPWAEVQKTGELWDPELTDLAEAVFETEKQNRERRLKKRNSRYVDLSALILKPRRKKR